MTSHRLFEPLDRTGDPYDLLASIISIITHPVVFGILALVTIVRISVETLTSQLGYLILLTALTFIPAALYLLVHFKGNVAQALELINREARLVPYLLLVSGAILAIIVLIIINAPWPIFTITLVLLANEVILGTINFWTKVSAHTATATFTAITLAYLLNPWWLILLLVVPLIGWARVYRKRHTINQVLGGTIFAALISTLVISLSHFLLA